MPQPFRFSKTLPVLALGASLTACEPKAPEPDPPPNIVLFFLDDAAFADFQPFAETRYPTPNVLQLAEQGRTFYNFYVPQAVCSASRAALLTGAYPERVGVFGAFAPELRGLDPQWATLAELLQHAGYTTAHFGKWHLGDHEDTRPPARGFDESSGIMVSNDMWGDHPVAPEYWGQYNLRYWKNGQVVIDSVTHEHQPMFTTWITDDSVDFINRNSGDPFFLYIPHPMPHVPLFVSERFNGASGIGLYADVIMELDWSVGEVMKALKANGVDEHTIVLFTSDNGPWLPYGNHAGKTPYRGEKATTFDGGVRSPLIIRYPRGLPAGTVSHDAFASIDLMPTLATLAGAPLPDYEIDGKNLWDLIRGVDGAENPHPYYAFTQHNRFEAVLSGNGHWKLHLPHPYRKSVGGRDGIPGPDPNDFIELSLFDMVHDPYEKVNVIDVYPEMAEQLLEYAEKHRQRFFPDMQAIPIPVAP